MSNVTYTRGPWHAVRNSAYWEVNPERDVGEDDVPFTVADCCVSDPGDTSGLQEANARLIAAAPDLLETLEAAYAFIADQYGCEEAQALQGEFVSAEARPVWHKICAAIAKAKGGAE